jgi:hypothetical protein
MLGNVHIRPMVWTVAPTAAYSPNGAHSEFSKTFDLSAGAILALDDEQIIEVTRPPLPTVESIFEIKSSENLAEGDFQVDLAADRIAVRMGPKTFELVQQLRQTDESTRIVNMNSLYVPVVMQVLSELVESGFDAYENYRWLHPFRSRCEQAGVELEKVDLLTDAQKLLTRPFATLRAFVDQDTDGGDDAN